MSKKEIEIEESNAADEASTASEQCDNTSETDTVDMTDSEEPTDSAEECEPEETPLEKAEKEIEVLKDKYLRSVAEFDNYRKRTLKEKAELILNGSERAVQAVLPVMDDIERALSNASKTDDLEVLKEGMALIYQKFEKVLESLGVKKIETAGAAFDVDYHEAIAMVPGAGDDMKGKVLDCVQTGYTLNDKVIRHAKVAVGQ